MILEDIKLRQKHNMILLICESKKRKAKKQHIDMKNIVVLPEAGGKMGTRRVKGVNE